MQGETKNTLGIPTININHSISAISDNGGSYVILSKQGTGFEGFEGGKELKILAGNLINFFAEGSAFRKFYIDDFMHPDEDVTKILDSLAKSSQMSSHQTENLITMVLKREQALKILTGHKHKHNPNFSQKNISLNETIKNSNKSIKNYKRNKSLLYYLVKRMTFGREVVSINYNVLRKRNEDRMTTNLISKKEIEILDEKDGWMTFQGIDYLKVTSKIL